MSNSCTVEKLISLYFILRAYRSFVKCKNFIGYFLLKDFSCLGRDYSLNGPDGCTPHHIKEQDLYDTVLKDIREWAAMALAELRGKSERGICLIRQYSDLQELNSCIINELITKILVSDKHRVNGEKVQSIVIHYRFMLIQNSGNRNH